MTFTSSIFLIGILPWFILSACLTKKQRFVKTILLVLMNSIFYIWGGIGAFFFVCCFTFFVWLFCNIITKHRMKNLFAAFVILTLLPLLNVKYSGFIIGNLNSLFGGNLAYPDVIVPLGISFFTFEAISLLCDVYWGKIEDEIYMRYVMNAIREAEEDIANGGKTYTLEEYQEIMRERYGADI